MPPHEQRVVEEAAELLDKSNKLHAFFSSSIFQGLDATNKDLLHRQHDAMLEYQSILQQRIALF